MNVCRIFIIVIFCFTTGCASAPIPVTHTPEEAVDALANQLMPVLQNLAKQLNPTIAIIPFGGPKGKPTPFGKKMAALLQSKLISKNWKLIEREQIDKILNEQHLTATGVVKENDYIHAGTVAGADFIIVGTTYYGKKALISVKIVNVRTSTVEGIAHAYITFEK